MVDIPHRKLQTLEKQYVRTLELKTAQLIVLPALVGTAIHLSICTLILTKAAARLVESHLRPCCYLA